MGKNKEKKKKVLKSTPPEKKEKLDYHIIGSGSTGNAVRIENILFDVGLPYSRIKDDLYLVDYILISHRHKDHFKENVLQRIKKEFPYIKVASNYDVAQRTDCIDKIFNNGFPFQLGTQTFYPFETIHDVPGSGYTFKLKGNDVVFCTDTKDYSNMPDLLYDYMFLESNYDKNVLQSISRKGNKGYFQYINSYNRHASKQHCKAIYYEHRKSRDSVLVELHKSERFYRE